MPSDVDFVSVQESFDTSSPFGKAMIGLLAVFAQLEREQIKERTQMGKLARAKAGLHHGAGYIPIGYDYQNGKLIVNPYEAEQVKKIFELYLKGFSLQGIIDRLHAAGYTNRYSSYNSWSSVRNILSNSVYTGKLKYGSVIVENAHEAIISDEQFKEVQKIRLKRQEIYGTNSFQSKHLLSGLIFCGHCGARYYHRDCGKYQYYSCYSRTKQVKNMIKNPDCKNKHWKADKLESLVEIQIVELLKSPKLALEIAEQSHKKAVAIKPNNSNIEKRIREIDRQINKFLELYKIDSIPPEILGENINKLYNEKTALQSEIQSSESSTSSSFDIASELLKNAAEIWEFADELQKRRILQNLIKRITLTDDNVEIEWNF